MFEIKGQYNSAKIFTDFGVEQEAYSQIQEFTNNAAFIGSHIAVMPDVHAGKGVPIGFTATPTDKTIPNVIGVDIGCGVLGHPVFISEEDFRKKADLFDAMVRQAIPMGLTVRSTPYPKRKMKEAGQSYLHYMFYEWYGRMEEAAEDTNQDFGYVVNSLGTLGGGNHFIEIDKDKDGKLWLVVHTGSRNFGLKVANFHQKKAYDNLTKKDVSGMVEEIKRTKKGKEIEEAIIALKKEAVLSVPRHLAYLDGKDRVTYLNHAFVAQNFAAVNRRIIIAEMLSFFGEKFDEKEVYESVHNYIDQPHGITRKGAISANKDEPVLIPLTMKAGIILGKGKGNKDWNYSAPHGAGRKMSRTKAKSELKLEDYKEEMKESGIWTSSVSAETLDEAPGAYKDPKEIIDSIGETVDVEQILTPIYNLKAGEKEEN
jgi:tRNA-splicing ligase RtcB (3'-phosphate/5'-hydroxy nucleic acid ligase)